MILNVYKTVLLLITKILIDEVMKKVSDETGVSKTTVYRIIHEYKKKNQELSPPKTNKNRAAYILNNVEDFHKSVIWRKVHDFFFLNELPTIDKVLSVVNEDSDKFF